MKKVISILLAVVLLFSTSASAFAAKAEESTITNNDPVILVRGMDFTNLMLDVGTESQRKANDFSTSEAVELAKKNTGHQKVNIVCASMGGILTVAYLTKYGYDSIARCLFLSSTFCGLEIVGDVLNGRIEITSERLYEYLLSLCSNDISTKFLIKLLYKAGIFD